MSLNSTKHSRHEGCVVVVFFFFKCNLLLLFILFLLFEFIDPMGEFFLLTYIALCCVNVCVVGGAVDGAGWTVFVLSPCPSLHTDVVQDCSVQMIFP